MTEEDAILEDAQRKLLAKRQDPRAQMGAAPARLAPPREVGPVVVSPELKQRRLYAVPPPDQPSPAAIERRIRETIPEAFHDISWDTLPTARGPEGRLSLGAVQTPRGRLRGAAAVRDIRDRMKHAQKVVLLGDTRSGKTIAGVAALEAELRRGNDRARWIHTAKLREPDVMARALSSSFLVLDDLGWELRNAEAGSGWLPNLCGPTVEFLGEWYLRRTACLVVTTAMGYEHMAKMYGAGAAARVYEGAEVIWLYPDP